MLTFLGLLFGVLWPYSARPAQSWMGWMPVEVDSQRGQVVVVCETPSSLTQSPTRAVYIVDEGVQPAAELGRFEVLKSDEQAATLAAATSLTAAEQERLAKSIGPWSLHEARPGSWPSHYADELARKDWVPAESFLMLDPLVSVSTGLAARQWGRAALWAAAIWLVCLWIPRAFCGYLCPLGTLIDVFDWAVSRRLPWRRATLHGVWAKLKFAVLAVVLGMSAAGLLLAAYVSAIPLLTRGLVCGLGPVQNGLLRGWHLVPASGAAEYAAVALLAVVLGLGLLRPRFWCRYLCPTGAVFALGSLLAISRRRVGENCVRCGRCADACPFGAIASGEHQARVTDCASCRTCVSVCPADAVEFAARWEPRVEAAPRSAEHGDAERRAARRGFLATAVSAAAAFGVGTVAENRKASAGHGDRRAALVRAPGSLPEESFLRLCVRCGACLRACPNGALQPVGIECGWEALWTPHVVADRAGCEASCNRCGQVCPTGAIRPLSLEEKRTVRMGRAVVDGANCLPHAGKAACQRCVDECATAGYRAIEFVRVGTELDAAGQPIEDSGFVAPVVMAEKCVGCGMCQSGCHSLNVVQKGWLGQAAIKVQAAEDCGAL